MTKPTLIVPDIHQRLEKLKEIWDKFPHDQFNYVYLGDWFDTFKAQDRAEDVVKELVGMLKQEMENPATVLLWGNHDYHYHDQRGLCSGYQQLLQMWLQEWLPSNWPESFRNHIYIGPYLLSHAGYYKALHKESAEAWRLMIGHRRGGFSPVGGPLWMDFHDEFQSFPDEDSDGPYMQMQIVGHTHGKVPRIKEGGICLDCSLDYVAVLTEEPDDYLLEIIKVKDYEK